MDKNASIEKGNSILNKIETIIIKINETNLNIFKSILINYIKNIILYAIMVFLISKITGINITFHYFILLVIFLLLHSYHLIFIFKGILLKRRLNQLCYPIENMKSYLINHNPEDEDYDHIINFFEIVATDLERIGEIWAD